jgi:hypothetical protein
VDPEVVKNLHETYAALQEEPKNTLEHELEYYIEKQYEFDEELRKDCSVEEERIESEEMEDFSYEE